MHGINNFPASENEIEIPLASVVNALPLELRAKIMSAPAAHATLRLKADAIVSQLGSGTVKISFGELRRLAPGLIANSGGEHDSRTVNLPLPEILARINPARLARRPVKKISVNDDIAGPFADRGRGVNFTSTPLKAPAAVAAAPQPLPPPAAAPAQNFDAPPLEKSAPIAFPPRAVPPASNGHSNGTNGSHPFATPAAPLTPPPNHGNTNGNGYSVTPFGLKISATPPPSAAAAAPAQTVIHAALALLAENWPAGLRPEMSQPPFAGASVPLPGDLIEAGLKRGRVTMTWRQIRLLVAVHSAASVNDALELPLPLKVIAPLFLAAKKNNFSAPARVTVRSDIPDLFFGFPQPAAAPALPGLPPLPKPQPGSQDTNYFVSGAQRQAPATEVTAAVRPGENLQTDFSSRQAAPKEVVARALALPGVAGAVVTLPDGLRVASEVPAELNADTLAAFLPQIFERVNQSTRELRMGALNNVSFTVGNVPWKIFRVNSVYFAVFGRAGEGLPSAQLVQLAAEIDRKKQS